MDRTHEQAVDAVTLLNDELAMTGTRVGPVLLSWRCRGGRLITYVQRGPASLIDSEAGFGLLQEKIRLDPHFAKGRDDRVTRLLKPLRDGFEIILVPVKAVYGDHGFTATTVARSTFGYNGILILYVPGEWCQHALNTARRRIQERQRETRRPSWMSRIS